MLDILVFIIGLILLLRGQFRLGNRFVPRAIGRRIGLVLILPEMIAMCGASLIVSAIPIDENMTFMQYTNLIMSDPRFDMLLTIETIALILAVGYVIFEFLRIPPGVVPPTWNQTPPRYPPNYPPNYPPYPPPGQSPSQTPGQPQYPPSSAFPFGGYPSAPPSPPAPSVMTTREAAAYLHITEDQVIQLIDDGKIPAAKTASGFRIAKSVIDEYLNEKP